MKNRSPVSVSVWITAAYVLAATAWVTIASLLVNLVAQSTNSVVVLETVGNIVLIGLTGLVLYVSLRRQISHRRAVEVVRDQTREALVETAGRYDRLETISPVGIYYADQHGQRLAHNQRWSEITGLTPEQAMGDGWMASIHPEDRERVAAEWRAALANTRPFNSEFRVQRPDGAVVWVISQAFPLSNAKGMTEYLGVLTDITPQKQAENAVKQAAHDYQLLFDRNPVPVWIYDTQTLRFMAVNDSAIEMYGYSREEFLRMTIKDIRPGEDVSALLEVLAEPCSGKAVSQPGVHLLKDGTHIIVRVTAIQLEYQGRSACIIAVDNITEQMRAEQTLRYQAGLLEATSDAVISTDNDLRILSWNAAAERIYGWKSYEVVGKPLADVVTVPGLIEREPLSRELATSGAWKGDSYHRRRDGTTFAVSSSAAVIHDQVGNATGYVSINRDVTEYRRADAELRQRNRELEALLSVISALSGRFDLDLMLDSITHATRDLLPAVDRASLWLYDNAQRQITLRASSGYSDAIQSGFTVDAGGSLIGMVFRTRQTVNIADTATSQGFKPVGNPEIDQVKSVIGVPLIAEGQVIGCLFGDSVTQTHAFADDEARLLLTLAGHAAVAILDAQLHQQMQEELIERLRAEEAMRASEELHRLAFKATPKVAIWDWNIMTGDVRWSDGIDTVYGYKPDRLETMMDDGWRTHTHADDRARVSDSLNEVVNGSRQNWSAEYRFRRADGSYALVSDRAFVVRDRAGRAVRMIGSLLDITDQKEAEQALRASEERFRRIAESAPDMIFRWTLRSGFEYVSPAASDISGYSPEEFYAAPDLLHRIVHVEDQAMLDDVFDAAQQATTTRSVALRWNNKAGMLVHIELRYMPLRDEQGNMLGIEGIAHDVSQHVVATLRLRELGQRLASTQDSERKRVALELHDDVGQMLTVAKMRLRMAINSLPKDSYELRGKLASLTMLVDDSLESIRALSHELHPPLLAEMGWQLALEGLCDSLSARSNLPIIFKNTGQVVRLSPDTEIALYRLVQEALTNAMRHGVAQNILVTSRVSRRMITIQVEDDGRGFDIEQVRSASQPGVGLGLLSMQERADAIDATLTITSRPGRGTKVVLRLPCRLKG